MRLSVDQVEYLARIARLVNPSVDADLLAESVEEAISNYRRTLKRKESEPADQRVAAENAVEAAETLKRVLQSPLIHRTFERWLVESDLLGLTPQQFAELPDALVHAAERANVHAKARFPKNHPVKYRAIESLVFDLGTVFEQQTGRKMTASDLTIYGRTENGRFKRSQPSDKIRDDGADRHFISFVLYEVLALTISDAELYTVLRKVKANLDDARVDEMEDEG